MTKKEKDEFLKNGGTLLRMVKRGERSVLRKKTISMDWHDGITNASEQIIRGTIDRLVKNHPTKFKENK